MNKYIRFWIIVILLLISQRGICSKGDSVVDKVARSEIRMLQDSIHEFKKDVEQFESREEYSEEKLKQNITIAQNTISSQNSIISSYGTLFTYITIIIGILAFILPIWFYFFGILPSKREIRKAKKIISEMNQNLDSKFEDYLSRKKDEQINEYIVLLGQVNGLQERIVTDYLMTLYYDELSYDQCDKLASAISKKKITNENRESITKLIHRLILRNSD